MLLLHGGGERGPDFLRRDGSVRQRVARFQSRGAGSQFQNAAQQQIRTGGRSSGGGKGRRRSEGIEHGVVRPRRGPAHGRVAEQVAGLARQHGRVADHVEADWCGDERDVGRAEGATVERVASIGPRRGAAAAAHVVPQLIHMFASEVVREFMGQRAAAPGGVEGRVVVARAHHGEQMVARRVAEPAPFGRRLGMNAADEMAA